MRILLITLFAVCCIPTTIISQTNIHSASFETDLNGWSQSTFDNFDWTRNSGGTPSGGTGPSSAYDGNYYMYIEATGNSAKTAIIESPSFDLTNVINPQFSFSYHMYGSDMGTLYVEISTDGGVTYPTSLWSNSSSNDFWIPQPINLSAYINQTIKIRFRGLIGGGYRSDMAIDDIKLSVSGPEINVIGNGVTIVDEDTLPSLTNFTDFGATNLSSPRSRIFYIQNTGDSTLNLTGTTIVSVSGNSEFTINTQPTTTSILSGGSDLFFEVLFTPSTLGNFSAIISIENNDYDEGTYNFTIQASTEQNFFDSDGDGIYDNIDIDDDNDGILDTEEETSCRNSNVAGYASYKFLNETFGTGARTTINTTYPAETTYIYENAGDLNDGEYTVGSSAQIASWAPSYWYMGGDHTGDVDGRMAMFNADYDPGLFYSATINGALPNIPITYSFWVLNLDRTDAPGIATRLRPNILVEFRDVNNNLLSSISTGDISPTTTGNLDGDWYNFSADLVLNVDEFYVYFYNNETGGLGNDLAIDDIIISQNLCDTDSDGVGDIFDLDSDNDGIPDIVECGLGNLSEGTAKIPYPSGWVDTNNNGMHDAAEGNVTLDSDGDGVPNHMDLDSDNDGVFDVDESGAGNLGNSTLQNGDGDISGDGVGEGLDTDAFRETDIDSNGTLEYFTDGILDIYDYFNGTDFTTSYGNINQGIGNTYFVLDSDADGLPDYIDVDSDNDGFFDIEATLYTSLDVSPLDGIIDDVSKTDTDGDGILDAFDTDNLVFGSPRDLERKLKLYFDGRNDYAEDDASILSNLGNATLMSWIKIDPTAIGDQVLLGQNEFYLQLNSNKSITAYANGNSISNGSALNLNQWVHVAATYSSTNSLLKIFINGELLDSTSVSGALPIDTSHFTIGRKPDTNSNYFKGYFDEVRVFDKALSENELHKMVYQEIEDNLGIVRGSVIPRDITNYVNSSTITPLDWTYLKRYFRMDVYKDDIIDDLTTTGYDIGTGATIYNVKIINEQTAPLPFITMQSGSLPTAVTNTTNGIDGNDAITYNWSIVNIVHDNVTYNNYQEHLGLIVNELDASSNAIEFSIQDDSELNVNWYLKLDGFIDLEGESQLLQGDDSILDEDSAGYIERDQQGTANSFNYNYWSSSVCPISNGSGSNNANYTISALLMDGTDEDSPNINGAVQFLAPYASADIGITSPIIISSYWLYKFYGPNSDYDSWQSIDENSTLSQGEAYTMKGTSGSVAITTTQNYVFKGKPNNGNISLELDKTSGDVDRLIGNPYPSAIDANEFIKDHIKTSENINSEIGRNSVNVFNGALYFWDHFGEINSHYLKDYVGGYATYTLMGATKAISTDARINDNNAVGVKLPTRYIPVNQGFFVITALDPDLELLGETTTTVDGGTINFKNSQRIFKTESSGNSVFMKSSTVKKQTTTVDEQDIRPKIRLMYDSPGGYHRPLLIGVDENTTNHFDIGYDAQIADVNNEDMYWIIDGGKFVIQAVNNFNTEQEFPLGVKVGEEGIVTISIDELENVDASTEIYIKDNLTGISENIKNTSFEINLEAGEYKDRFLLTFKSNETLSIEEGFLENDTQIIMNNIISEIQIKSNNNTKIKNIKLYNNLGQVLKIWTNNFTEKKINLPVKYQTGIYIVQINTLEGEINKKILIN